MLPGSTVIVVIKDNHTPASHVHSAYIWEIRLLLHVGRFFRLLDVVKQRDNVQHVTRWTYEVFRQHIDFCQNRLLWLDLHQRGTKEDHITPVMRGLHLLPVSNRINYKLPLVA